MKQLEKLTLDNGLRVLLLPVEGALSASVGVWVEAGARYESADQTGHLPFCGAYGLQGYPHPAPPGRYPRRWICWAAA